MTSNKTDYVPPSARQLLHDHGLPEDVIDGVLCLHGQELAAAIRAETEALKADGVLEPDKFRPCRDAANQIDPTVPDDTDLSEADIDRMMAVATPVQIVTAPPGTFAAVSVPPPAPRADNRAAVLREAADAIDLDLDTEAPWETIRERVRELRRLADETPDFGLGLPGFPLVADPALPAGEVHLRPHPRPSDGPCPACSHSPHHPPGQCQGGSVSTITGCHCTGGPS